MNGKLVRQSVYIVMLSMLGSGIFQPAGKTAISQQRPMSVMAQLSPASPTPQPIVGRGQCRSLRRAAFIYKGRSLDSMTLTRLDPEQQVVLAENSPVNGFIAIESPELGYVQVANLKSCTSTANPGPGVRPSPGTPGTNPGVGLCRRIINRNGLDVWSKPEPRDFVARLPVKSEVYLTDPPVLRQGAGELVWVKIARPVPGWAVGVIKGITVLTPCT